jgi:N-acetyltransferase 10
LPISSHIKAIEPVKRNIDLNEENSLLTERERDLKTLQQSLKDKIPIGNLVTLCKTLDQAKCVMSMVDSISEKSGHATVSINAGRGRVYII